MKKKEIAKTVIDMSSQSLIDVITLVDYYLTHNGGHSPEAKRLINAIENMEIKQLVAAREVICDEMFMRDIAILNARGRQKNSFKPTLCYDPPPPRRPWA